MLTKIFVEVARFIRNIFLDGINKAEERIYREVQKLFAWRESKINE